MKPMAGGRGWKRERASTTTAPDFIRRRGDRICRHDDGDECEEQGRELELGQS